MIRLLKDRGWYLARTSGSHRQFRHPSRSAVVTVAGKPSDVVKPGTWKSIQRQAGLPRRKADGQ